MTAKIAVSADALQTVLNAVTGPSHLIREMLALCSSPELFPENPLNVLLAESDAAVPAVAPAEPERPRLSVWVGRMPESNGKSNYTAILQREGGNLLREPHITIERSEYPGRVQYAADQMRYLIGELSEEPCITEYDTDEHSGYKPSGLNRLSYAEQELLSALRRASKFISDSGPSVERGVNQAVLREPLWPAINLLGELERVLDRYKDL